MSNIPTPEALLSAIRVAAVAVRRQEAHNQSISDGAPAQVHREAEATLDERVSAFDALEDSIPKPPRSLVDVLSLAEMEAERHGGKGHEDLYGRSYILANAVLHYAPAIEIGAGRAKTAAAEILSLVNSQPCTPRLAEIEAIVARCMSAEITQPDPISDPLVQEVIAAAEAFETACDGGATEDEVAALHAQLIVTARKVWSRTPTTLADVLARAIVSEGWNAEVESGTGSLTYRDPTALAAEHRPPECDWSAEAHLLDAIRKVIGHRPYRQPRMAAPTEGKAHV